MNKINFNELAKEVLADMNKNAANILSKYSISSSRSVGDAVQNYLGTRCLPKLLKKYGITDVVNHTGPKELADISFTYDGVEYSIDVKTHKDLTEFNMPNIISMERLEKLYKDDANIYCVLMVKYNVIDGKMSYEDCFVKPIENISWDSLIVSALGNGQIQIKDSKSIKFSKSSRKVWMDGLVKKQVEFYDKQIAKWQKKKALLEASAAE